MHVLIDLSFSRSIRQTPRDERMRCIAKDMWDRADRKDRTRKIMPSQARVCNRIEQNKSNLESTISCVWVLHRPRAKIINTKIRKLEIDRTSRSIARISRNVTPQFSNWPPTKHFESTSTRTRFDSTTREATRLCTWGGCPSWTWPEMLWLQLPSS